MKKYSLYEIDEYSGTSWLVGFADTYEEAQAYLKNFKYDTHYWYPFYMRNWG